MVRIVTKGATEKAVAAQQERRDELQKIWMGKFEEFTN
jgi:hypothetical protein